MIYLIARLILIVVFVIAGFAKLADLPGSRRAVRDFGIPDALASPIGTLLPLGEIAIGLALILGFTVWWGAVGALVLLLLYIIVIGFNLARGRRPNCHCFGALYSAPAGRSTLLRNGLLVVLAALLVRQGPNYAYANVVGWLPTLRPFEIMTIIFAVIILGLLAVAGWFLLLLLQQNGRLLLRIEVLEKALEVKGARVAPLPATVTNSLPIGAVAPAFQLSGLDGQTHTLDALRDLGKPLLLIFIAPDCGPCNALLPEISRWQHQYAAKTTVTLISYGTPEANRTKSREYKLSHVLLQDKSEVAEKYRVGGTPSAILVRPDGTIGSAPVAGADAIRKLVSQLAEPPAVYAQPAHLLPTMTSDRRNGNGHSSGSALTTKRKIGELAPELKLPDTAGGISELTEFRGNDTLLLFWNPKCGYCSRMLDELKIWESTRPMTTPQLVFISTGTAEENRALGLQSPILLDRNFSAAGLFGANGTPSAVLIDAEGLIASELAVGTPAVLALAKTAAPVNNRQG
jgi:peroxiredoxin/uncharacterized membrane protein YphA (DoxX/SURF4 family)